ncbi:MAG TPA: CidA/LrgA family protein [Lachnospiraceae bacterium]|nr:CidA/LrgA family protein [Lachnospiraceae bacterium]
MKLMIQILIVFGLCLLGEGIALILPFTFPASLISMIILLILLISKLIKVEHIKELSEFLLSNMAFFFVPAGIAIIEQYSLLKGKILILLFVCIITTILTFLATAFTVSTVMRIMHKGENEHE